MHRLIVILIFTLIAFSGCDSDSGSVDREHSKNSKDELNKESSLKKCSETELHRLFIRNIWPLDGTPRWPSAYCVEALLDKDGTQTTVVYRALETLGKPVNLASLKDIRRNFEVTVSNSENKGNTKRIEMEPERLEDFPIGYSTIMIGHKPIKPKLEHRVLKLKENECIAAQVFLAQTAFAANLRNVEYEIDTVEILPPDTIQLGKDATCSTIPRSQVDGFVLHKREGAFALIDPTADPDEREEAMFEEVLYANAMCNLWKITESHEYTGDAKVRLTAAMSPNTGQLYLFVQSLSKTPFSLHMKSVEDIRNAFTIEAFDYKGTKIEFNPPAASPPKTMRADDNKMRAADLHEGEMIGNSIYLEVLSFYKFIFLEGRLSFGEGLPVTLPIDKVILTPKASIFQADEEGNPIPYTGKIEVQPLVLVAGELKRLEKLFKKIGFQSVGHTMAEPLLSKDGQPLSATPKVEEEKKP